MITHLIPATEFVLLSQIQEMINDGFDYKSMACDLINDYAKFLSQTPKLEMFVPCDEDGNVLKHPDSKFGNVVIQTGEISYSVKYDKANSKVLFKNYTVRDDNTLLINGNIINISAINNFTTLNDMLELKHEYLELTDTTLIKLNLK